MNGKLVENRNVLKVFEQTGCPLAEGLNLGYLWVHLWGTEHQSLRLSSVSMHTNGPFVYNWIQLTTLSQCQMSRGTSIRA